MKEVRSRFAPSPTGYMHIGNLRSAIYEYIIAKKYNGKFILRIEDTDQNRFVEGATEFIYKTLELCNIIIDEGPNNEGAYGPYIQSKRLEIYKKYAEELVKKGHAYYCFCDKERLDNLREIAEKDKRAFLYDGKCSHLTKEEIDEKIKARTPYVIRQKMPKDGSTSYNDLAYGNISVENKLLEDQILLKSDSYPTYNFANVIDDHLMEITHVVRGNEYLSSTPKYILLYKAYGWDYPEYVHLPHVIKEGGKKISKRDGDASFMDLYNDGYLPEAIVNYLVLLGYSPVSNKEIFTIDEILEEFDLSRINTSPAVYDVKKLNWINSHYIKKLNIEDLYKITHPHLEKAYNLEDIDKEWIEKLILLYQNQLSFGAEIVEQAKMFFTNDITLGEEEKTILASDGVLNTLNVFKEEIEALDELTVENIKQAIKNTSVKASVKGKDLFMPIRIKTTGVMHGPELADSIFLIGKDNVLKRLSI